MKAACSKRIVSKITRSLVAAAVLVALSSLQSSWSTLASICQIGSERDTCQCRNGCKPKGQTFDPARAEQIEMHSTAVSVASNTPSAPSGGSCCQVLPQSDRPIVTSSAQETAVEIETAPLLSIVRAVEIASIRTHDPPNTRPLYLTNSCLLI